LPRRLIRMFSFPGETVLDPFTGSGTTNFAAMQLERNSIGYEINDKFLNLAEKRLENDSPSACGGARGGVFVTKSKTITVTALRHLRTSLPYLFEDPVRISKQSDPRKMYFGSKITGNETEEELVREPVTGKRRVVAKVNSTK
jgi:hypothetical protein